MGRLYEGDIFADYFQLYLRDEGNTAPPEDYSDESIARRLMTAANGVIVHTERNMRVPVCVDWYDAKPAVALDSFQHVVDGGFDCPTGRLILSGMTDDEMTSPRLAVTAGALGIRVCFSGLDTLSDDGLSGDDRYLIALWPESAPPELQILKVWQES